MEYMPTTNDNLLRRVATAAGLRIFPVLGALLAATCPNAVVAQVDASVAPEEIGEQDVARRYAVEFIVFVYADAPATEVFVPEYPEPAAIADGGGFPDFQASGIDGPEGMAVPEFGDMVAEGLPDEELEEIISGDSVGLEVMLPEERGMQAIWDKLTLLDAYRPVMWSGWTQAVRDEATTPAIPLRRLGAAPLDLDGTLKLYLSRYLHLVADLSLEDRTAAAQASNPYGGATFGDTFRNGRDDAYGSRPTVRYRIDEDRIVRSDELRYFDHPKFGVVARITRVDEPAMDTSGDLMPAPRSTPAQRPN